ncbi:MAG: hypothetical protein KDK90_06290 [Leptospiraceae bacterium]|nr:hypothetical protein [Leptospiraceae bacterium]
MSTLLYFLTPIRYLFYDSSPQNTSNQENTSIENNENSSMEKEPVVESYNTLVKDSYITISKYYQVPSLPELKTEVLSKSIEFVRRLETIQDSNLNLTQSIEKYYIMGNLLLCAADMETHDEQKKFLSDLSLKSIKTSLTFIQESESTDSLTYQWVLEENMIDRLQFYITLNLCIKRIAGESIDTNKILESLNSIPKEKRDTYNLDNHHLILQVLNQDKERLQKGEKNE